MFLALEFAKIYPLSGNFVPGYQPAIIEYLKAKKGRRFFSVKGGRYSAQRVPEPDPLPSIFFIPYSTRFSFENHCRWVASNPKYRYYLIFWVNPKFRVLPNIWGIPRHDWVLGSPQ